MKPGDRQILFGCGLPATLAAVEPAAEQQNGSAKARPLDRSVIRGAGHRYGITLDKTLRSAVVPYGYTVTIWASGAYLISLRGVPGAVEAFCFVAGALAAFGILASLSQRQPNVPRGDTIAPPIHPDSSHPIFAAGLHIAAVGLAFAAAALVDELLGTAAWFFGSFAVTLIYLSIASAELAIAVEMHQREIAIRAPRLLPRRGPRPEREPLRRR